MQKKLSLCLVAAIALSGCQMNNTQKGATIGAISGALLGKATGNHKNKRAVIGAAVGAIAGAAVGDYMDKQEDQLRDELKETGVGVHREGDELRLDIPSEVTFDINRASISPRFYPVLDDVARVMKHYDRTYIVVEGHTDDTGAASYNLQLSQARAQTVKGYLTSQAIIPARISTYGFGETRPKVPNSSKENRRINRRVEIRIIPNEG
ncbi:OmpA family protein [Algicola sagamiensis]|uniref:OmpA family protein n=1 Tax=Algicola sagamiensis TaxID=163869 RepID=UPI00036FE9CC|nr:OmpA family protein [Algicola sagamiensis]